MVENLVDLVKSFQTSIYYLLNTVYCLLFTLYLQILALVQPRTSLSKCANNSPEIRMEVKKNIGFRSLHRIAKGTNYLADNEGEAHRENHPDDNEVLAKIVHYLVIDRDHSADRCDERNESARDPGSRVASAPSRYNILDLLQPYFGQYM